MSWSSTRKLRAEDLLIRISATNRGPEPARLHLLPTIWFRNNWSWRNDTPKPTMSKGPNGRPDTEIVLDHPQMGRRYLYCENKPVILFTENETNNRRLYDAPGPVFCKDGINDYVVNGRLDAVNPESHGTKAAPQLPVYRCTGRNRKTEASSDGRKLARLQRSAQRGIRSRVPEPQARSR